MHEWILTKPGLLFLFILCIPCFQWTQGDGILVTLALFQTKKKRNKKKIKEKKKIWLFALYFPNILLLNMHKYIMRTVENDKVSVTSSFLSRLEKGQKS